jgi:hypothetical protein
MSESRTTLKAAEVPSVRSLDVRPISEQTEQFQHPGGAELEKEWPALLRLLDRRGIAYRN